MREYHLEFLIVTSSSFRKLVHIRLHILLPSFLVHLVLLFHSSESSLTADPSASESLLVSFIVRCGFHISFLSDLSNILCTEI